MLIYKVTNLVNNKVYIGKTISGLRKRKNKHLSDSRNKLYKCVFHDAIRKYGEDSFVWEILDRVMFSDLLIDSEKFYIKKYNCKIPNGYNMTDGGEGICGFSHTEETKRKISKAHVGKKHSPETIKKMSGKNNPMFGRTGEKNSQYGVRKFGKDNPHFGKRVSIESRNKMSAMRIGRHPTAETRKKMSDNQKGEGNNFFGKKHTEETRKKISAHHADMRGKNSPMFGRKMSEETKRKIIETRKLNRKNKMEATK